MDCDKCMKTCVELRRSDGEILSGHYNILCKKCWGKTYKDGQENDYIKQNEDGEMIGCCEECLSADEALTIWDIEHEHDLVNMVKELEEDGDWNFVYTNQALCEGCNAYLEEEIEAEYEEMKERQAEEEEEEEEPEEEEPEETFNCGWKPMMAKIIKEHYENL
jgi:hypothetical protein